MQMMLWSLLRDNSFAHSDLGTQENIIEGKFDKTNLILFRKLFGPLVQNLCGHFLSTIAQDFYRQMKYDAFTNAFYWISPKK